MRVADESPQSPETVREEIEDLQSYLAGLPQEWRESGSFLAYEERLKALDHELALGRIAELASTLMDPSTRRRGLDVHEGGDAQERLLAILTESEREYAKLAATHARTTRVLSYCMSRLSLPL